MCYYDHHVQEVGINVKYCRHLIFQSWQETIGNTISSWHFRPESKLITSLKHGTIPNALYRSSLLWFWTNYNQTTCWHSWLYFRRRHGWDDQLREARPQGGVRLCPGGLQGPQGQLDHPHHQGSRSEDEKNFCTTSVTGPDMFCNATCVISWQSVDRLPHPISHFLKITTHNCRRCAGIPDFLTADDMLG